MKNAKATERIRNRVFLVQAVMGWERYKFMPISVKTMRDMWDKERVAVQKQSEPAVFSRTNGASRKHAEEGFAKTKKYFLEYLELKKAVMDFFPEYQRYL